MSIWPHGFNSPNTLTRCLFLLPGVRHLSDNVEWMSLGRWCSFWLHSEIVIIFHPQNGKWLVKWRHLWQSTAWKTTVLYNMESGEAVFNTHLQKIYFSSFPLEIFMHFNYKIVRRRRVSNTQTIVFFSWHKLLWLPAIKILINTILNDNPQYIIFKNLCMHAHACVYVRVCIPLECHWPSLNRLFHWLGAHQLGQIDSSVCSRNLSIYGSLALGLQVYVTLCDIFTCVLGIKFRFWYLLNKLFTDRAISPDPEI